MWRGWERFPEGATVSKRRKRQGARGRDSWHLLPPENHLGKTGVMIGGGEEMP